MARQHSVQVCTVVLLQYNMFGCKWEVHAPQLCTSSDMTGGWFRVPAHACCGLLLSTRTVPALGPRVELRVSLHILYTAQYVLIVSCTFVSLHRDSGQAASSAALIG